MEHSETFSTFEETQASAVFHHAVASGNQAGINRALEKRIRAAAGTSLPVSSPPVFRAAEGRPAASQLQRVFASLEEKVFRDSDVDDDDDDDDDDDSDYSDNDGSSSSISGASSSGESVATAEGEGEGYDSNNNETSSGEETKKKQQQQQQEKMNEKKKKHSSSSKEKKDRKKKKKNKKKKKKKVAKDPILMQKEKLEAIIQAFKDDNEAGRSLADKTLQAFRLERSIAKDETDEADKLVRIALNALARQMNEALSAVEAAAVSSLTVGRDSILRAGLSACARGLVMPYNFFDKAAEMAQTSIASTFEHWVVRGHARVSLAADEAAARGVQHTTESLADLEKTMSRREGVFTQGQMELFSGVKSDCETALRAALVWRMLHQVQGNVSGMKTAVVAFEQLLPCIFSNMTNNVHELPHMPSLGGQVMQLLRYPTLATEINSLRTSAEHLRLDADYFRKAMQHWAVTIWFRQLVGERRKNGVLDRVGNSFDRLSRRSVKRKAFAAWKMIATRGRIARFVLQTSHELSAAMNASRVDKQQVENNGGGGGDYQEQENKQKAAAEALKKEQQQAEQDLTCLQSSEPWTLLGETALDAVKTLTVVCSTFRTQISRQREQIDRLESERDNLRDKSSLLESKLMRQIEITNTKNNEIERLKQELHNTKCGFNNASSRLLQQEHVPWRQQALELVKQITIVPPLRNSLVNLIPANNNNAGGFLEEDEEDENNFGGVPSEFGHSFIGGGASSSRDPLAQSRRSTRSRKASSIVSRKFSNASTSAATHDTKQHHGGPHPPSSPGRKNSHRPQQQHNRSPNRSVTPNSSSSTAAKGEESNNNMEDEMNNQQQQQQQFSIYETTPINLDDPENILMRWVNSCLEDLQELENYGTSFYLNQQISLQQELQHKHHHHPSPSATAASSSSSSSSAAAAAATAAAAANLKPPPPLVRLRCGNKFSWEWSDSLLLSRLLYYCALPKFNSASRVNSPSSSSFRARLVALQEQQLLLQQNQQDQDFDRQSFFTGRANSVYSVATTGSPLLRPGSAMSQYTTKSFGGASAFTTSKNATTKSHNNNNNNNNKSPSRNPSVHPHSSRPSFRDSASVIGGGGDNKSVFSVALPPKLGESTGGENVGEGGDGAAGAGGTRKERRGAMPSVKNAQAVVEYSRSCRDSLLEGEAAIEMTFPYSSVSDAWALFGKAHLQKQNENPSSKEKGGENSNVSADVDHSPESPASLASTVGDGEASGGGLTFMKQFNQSSAQAARIQKQREQQDQLRKLQSQQPSFHVDPTYLECFHDFNVASAKQKCETACVFAREILDLEVPAALESDLLSGQKSSIIVLVSLLYLKFAHPLCHGREQGIEPAPQDVIKHQQNIIDTVSSATAAASASATIPSAAVSGGGGNINQQQNNSVSSPKHHRGKRGKSPGKRGGSDGKERRPTSSQSHHSSNSGRHSRSNSNSNSNVFSGDESANNPVESAASASGPFSPSSSSSSSSNFMNNTNTTTNPFPGAVTRSQLIAGGIWKEESVDNPHVLQEVCSWASMLRRSLEEHRWYICKEILFVDSIVARDLRQRSLTALRRASLQSVHIPRFGLPAEDSSSSSSSTLSLQALQAHTGQSKKEEEDEIEFQHHCSSIFMDALESAVHQTLKAASAGRSISSSSSSSSSPSGLLPSSSAPSFFPSSSSASGSQNNKQQSYLTENLSTDLSLQFRATLPKIVDLFDKKSVIEFDSGGVKGLKQATLLEVLTDSDILPQMISRDVIHNMIGQEKQSRENTILSLQQQQKRPGEMSRQTSGGFLTPSASGGGSFLSPSATSASSRPGSFNRADSSFSSAALSSSSSGSGKLIAFDELVGILARITNHEIFRYHSSLQSTHNNELFGGGNNNNNSSQQHQIPPNYRCQVFQRLSTFAESSETSKFISQLDSLTVAEKYSSYRDQLKSLFDSICEHPDDKARRMAGLATTSSSSSSSVSSIFGNNSNNSGAEKLIVTFETFSKIVQESAVVSITSTNSSMANSSSSSSSGSFTIGPTDLIKYVYEEAVRISSIKPKRLLSSSAAALSLTMRKPSNVAGARASSSSSGSYQHQQQHHSSRDNTAKLHSSMNFPCFVRAVALLAHVHDPLPTVSFPERLARFIPQFVESVRPVTQAMARAKNQESDRRVKSKVAQDRTIENSPLQEQQDEARRKVLEEVEAEKKRKKNRKKELMKLAQERGHHRGDESDQEGEEAEDSSSVTKQGGAALRSFLSK